MRRAVAPDSIIALALRLLLLLLMFPSAVRRLRLRPWKRIPMLRRLALILAAVACLTATVGAAFAADPITVRGYGLLVLTDATDDGPAATLSASRELGAPRRSAGSVPKTDEEGGDTPPATLPSAAVPVFPCTGDVSARLSIPGCGAPAAALRPCEAGRCPVGPPSNA